MTSQTSTGALSPLVGRGSLSRILGLPEWLRSALFLQSSGGRLGWRRVLAGAAFVVAGTAVSLARTSGPGALNTTWIEDAGNFLQDGLHQSLLTTITTQMNGYYDVVPRAITAFSVAFPVAWAPGVMSACAAAGFARAACFSARRGHGRAGTDESALLDRCRRPGCAPPACAERWARAARDCRKTRASGARRPWARRNGRSECTIGGGTGGIGARGHFVVGRGRQQLLAF